MISEWNNANFVDSYLIYRHFQV